MMVMVITTAPLGWVLNVSNLCCLELNKTIQANVTFVMELCIETLEY